ncbi:carbon-nitrogen hydrolase family protein [Chloroflexi bacterium TSY]|nr:carbon-nitrogen hydrolase family protein [Chloroflexi bacterium TSY]
MRRIKIGLAQCPQSDQFNRNTETVLRYLSEAAEAGVQIVCFPEAQTVGYRVDITPADALVPAEELANFHQLVAQQCSEFGMACILGTETVPEASHGKPFNSALVISERGDILGAHHKTKLTPLDHIAYSPGETIETFELFGVKVGVVICFEGLRFPETTRECVRQGAQLVFHPQNNTTRPNDWKIPIHHAMIRTRAAENTIWFASCNCCLIPHQNCKSMIVAPDGRIHAEADLHEERLLVADIDLDLATRAMFNYDLEGSAPLLFADTVAPSEYVDALPTSGNEAMKG